ncbi:unnamed protein product [Menidia menidia]|uniref:TIMELESS-interacting protein n=1 Tax=Menidia menidia TaxID=238744 RepID=A0A8S4A9V4_9TELE|nr:unnamed protein product [Menidia menidia]
MTDSLSEQTFCRLIRLLLFLLELDAMLDPQSDALSDDHGGSEDEAFPPLPPPHSPGLGGAQDEDGPFADAVSTFNPLKPEPSSIHPPSTHPSIYLNPSIHPTGPDVSGLADVPAAQRKSVKRPQPKLDSQRCQQGGEKEELGWVRRSRDRSRGVGTGQKESGRVRRSRFGSGGVGMGQEESGWVRRSRDGSGGVGTGQEELVWVRWSWDGSGGVGMGQEKSGWVGRSWDGSILGLFWALAPASDPEAAAVLRLLSDRGLPALRTLFEDVRFRGKGHEAEDLRVLVQRMENWAHRLFPKLQFEDFMEKVEKLGGKKEVQEEDQQPPPPTD